MQKRCNSCETIVDDPATLCARCGSRNPWPQTVIPVGATEPNEDGIPFRVYKISFALAAMIEGFALWWFLGSAGMRHSPNSPMYDAEILIYLLHLPTILLSWAFGSSFAAFVPVTQLIFWTYLFAGVWKRFRNLGS